MARWVPFRVKETPVSKYYVYRTTTDKLIDSFDHVEVVSDHKVMWPVFLGGRDWLLICDRTDRQAIHHAALKRLEKELQPYSDRVERGAREGIRKAKDAD